MTRKLAVTVAMDMGSGTITITPTGQLTLGNVPGLLPVARRAASLAPDFSLIVDLRALSAADPQAVQLLMSDGPRGARFLGPGHDTPNKTTRRRPLPGTRRATVPAADGGMSVESRDVGEPPAPGIFGTVRRWPLVPSAELYRLQAALTQGVELAGAVSGNELLALVSDELERRTAEPSHENAPAIRAGHAGTPPSPPRPPEGATPAPAPATRIRPAGDPEGRPSWGGTGRPL